MIVALISLFWYYQTVELHPFSFLSQKCYSKVINDQLFHPDFTLSLPRKISPQIVQCLDHYPRQNKIMDQMQWRLMMIKIQKSKFQSNRFYYFTNISAWGYPDRNRPFGMDIFGILLVLVSLIDVTHEQMSHIHDSYLPFHPLLLSKSFLVAYSSCAFMDIDLHFILGQSAYFCVGVFCVGVIV